MPRSEWLQSPSSSRFHCLGLVTLFTDFEWSRWMGRNGRVAAETAFTWEAIADQDFSGLSFLTRLEVVLSDFRCHRLRTVSANRSKSPLLTAIPHTRFACDGLHCTTHLFWAEEGFSGKNRPVRIDQKRLVLFTHSRPKRYLNRCSRPAGAQTRGRREGGSSHQRVPQHLRNDSIQSPAMSFPWPEHILRVQLESLRLIVPVLRPLAETACEFRKEHLPMFKAMRVGRLWTYYFIVSSP